MESGGCAQFWAELICVMVCGLRESLVDQGRDLSGLERVAFNFLNHFQVKTFFFRFFTHNAHAKHLIFRPKSNQNIPNHCTTWTLGNFSRAWIVFTNQIPFCLLRIRSVTCYFLVNNLYFCTQRWHKTPYSTDSHSDLAFKISAYSSQPRLGADN